MQMRVLAVVMAESRICSGLVERGGFWRCDGDVGVDRCPVHKHELALGTAPAAVIGAPPAAWLSQAPAPQARGRALGRARFMDGPHGTVTNPPKRVAQSGHRTKVT